MREHKIGDLRFFSYGLFDPIHNVTNVITARVGGQSREPFATLNLGLHVGDDADHVLENRARIAQALGLDPEKLTIPQQIHGAKVGVVSASSAGRGAVTEDDEIGKVDALITQASEIPLMILVADCVPVSFYDPVRRTIGLAHAGWKGTLGRIVAETVARMAESFGSKPADILVGIGPSIGRGHYEVSEELLTQFKTEFGRETAAANMLEDMDGTCYLDLWGINKAQLVEAGLPASNIEVAGMCTACYPDHFYSHRHENGQTGRFAKMMMLHASSRRVY